MLQEKEMERVQKINADKSNAAEVYKREQEMRERAAQAQRWGSGNKRQRKEGPTGRSTKRKLEQVSGSSV